jgi:Cryptococcal mannosyltransferase 1
MLSLIPIVFMDASPFYNQTSPLRFRGIPDSLATHHLEASECCLIHADNHLTLQKGVWLNPRVRVGYSGEAYDAVHRSRQCWLTASEMVLGVWENRLRRWTSSSWLENRVVYSRLRSWAGKAHGQRTESGVHCLINEMQVLIGIGWAHL